jgi:MFS family permease
VLAVNGLMILAVQPLAIRILANRDRGTVLAVSMLLAGLGLGLGAIVDSAAGFIGSALVWTAGEIGIAVMFGAVFADLAPADLRGSYMGIGAASWGVGNVLGPLVGTAVLGRAGPTVLWLGCAATGAALFAAQQAIAPRLRGLPAARKRCIVHRTPRNRKECHGRTDERTAAPGISAGGHPYRRTRHHP